MHPELPRSITRGQIRRTVGIVEQAEWRALSIDERDAADTDDAPPELEFYCPACAEREFGDA